MSILAIVKERRARLMRWLFDPFETPAEPDEIRNPFFRDTEPGYKARKKAYCGRMADRRWREAIEYEESLAIAGKCVNLSPEPDEPFTGGISPLAWCDMELEESVSFASLSGPEEPPEAEIAYNPLFPESVDELLPPEPEQGQKERRGFPDEVIIITPRPKEPEAPLLDNYMNM